MFEAGLPRIRRTFVRELKTFNTGTKEAFNDEKNKDKNRYEDIALSDNGRVKITISPDDGNNTIMINITDFVSDDYIHASYVKVSPGLTYICAQGPLDITTQQFWLMIVQEEVKVILQLCTNSEDGREKSSDYIPENKELTPFGPVSVQVEEVSKNVPSTKKVVETRLTVHFDGKKHSVTHFLYSGWPDHDIPDGADTCIQLRKLAHSLCQKKPIVIHCSAGIGRTGTFAVVDMILHKIVDEENGDFSMPDLFKELREQRMHAIQNDMVSSVYVLL